jgi:hypothetical protein
MALTGDQIEEITRAVVELYGGAERAIVEEVTRQLAAGLDAPDWAANRLGALSTLRQAVESILAVVADEGAEAIRDTLAQAYRTGSAAATTGVPAELLPRDPAAVQAAAAASEAGIRTAVVENLAVALVQDVGVKHSNVLRHVEDVYRRVIAQAAAVSVAGGQTRRQAAQFAYQQFVDQGLTSFTDSRGRQWRLSSYVEMATRTVTQRAAVQGQTDRLQRLGVDTVIVSNSPRECPKCRPWEGKVLSIGGGQTGRVELPSRVRRGETVTVDIAGTVEQARAAGLQHPNCTHSLRAFLPGATKAPRGDLSNAKGYEAKQRQREIERNIRKYKERELAALTPEATAAARAKVRAWQGAMRGHLKAHPELKRLPYREVPGAGNLPRKRPPGAAGRPVTPTPPQPPPPPAATAPPAPTPAPAPAPKPATFGDRVTQGWTSERKLGGGVMADTELVKLADGTRAVRKRATDSVGIPAVDQTDAEELGALVARAAGVRAPAVHRSARDEVFMEFVDGDLFDELDSGAARALQASDEGARLGLADLLMGNTDRNGGNLLVKDGRIRAIDHGTAFAWHDEYNPPSRPSQFRDDWWRAFGTNDGWHDSNPLSPSDIAKLDRRLRDLRPEFERLGRLDWWDGMMGRLAALTPYAKGKGLLG